MNLCFLYIVATLGTFYLITYEASVSEWSRSSTLWVQVPLGVGKLSCEKSIQLSCGRLVDLPMCLLCLVFKSAQKVQQGRPPKVSTRCP